MAQDRTVTPSRTDERGGRRLARDGGPAPWRDEPVAPPQEPVHEPAPHESPDATPQSGPGPKSPADGPFVTPWRDSGGAGTSSGPVVKDGPVIRDGPFISETDVIAPEIPERPDRGTRVLGPPPKRLVRVKTANGWEWVSTEQPQVETVAEDEPRPSASPPPPRDYTPEEEPPARRSRRAAGKLARARLKRVSPGESAFLEKLDGSEVLVVPGRMDNLEEVLDNASIPYHTVFAETFQSVPLHPLKNIVMINCPGEGFDAAGLKRLVKFVNAGGWVITTDWAIRSVLEKAFPGIIRAAPRDTDEECVPVRMQDTSHPFLAGVFDPARPPLWSLDLDSFPIEIVKPRAVRVLLSSPAMKAKYGHDSIGVIFEQQRGQVFHLTSHFCLQRAPADGPLARLPATQYIEDEIAGRDVPQGVADGLKDDLKGVTAAELEAHYTATKMIANVIVEHARRARAMAHH